MSLSIDDFVEAHFDDVEAQGADLAVPCVFCNTWKRKLIIHRSTGVYHCWVCGEAGTFSNLRRALPEIFPGQTIVIRKQKLRKDIKFRKLSGMPASFTKFADMDPEKMYKSKAYKYLRSRGIWDQTIFLFELGFCKLGRMAKRVVVPILRDSEVVSYLGRDYTGTSKSKVLYEVKEKVNPVSMFLFNYDDAKKYKTCIVVEGWVDAIKTWQRVRGQIGVVASFGKNLTKEQIDLLIDGDFEEIIFMWDLDAARQQLEFVKWLSEISDIYTTELGEKDPGEMEDREFWSILSRRKKY